ncbi:MAG: gliding motility-associated C-terminal domain-containing protein [Bacteroidales bacterium]|nr:gliding motility-associated C-terminal domain-containing protein [Bacteroidales bacterium]
MINAVCNKLKFNAQTSEKIHATFVLLTLFIFFCQNANSQVTVPVPVVTLENTPACGETAILTASLSNNAQIPNGYICQWFTDAECTNEITSGYSGTSREHLEITSDNGLTVYCRLRATTTATLVTNFPYTGSEQVYNFPAGYQSFTMEVWDAQGGGRQINGRGGDGGKGGYSIGTLNSSSGITSIYVYVGGMGSCSPEDGGIAYGGWNGGGTSWASPRTIIGLNSPAAGGGGGTDIRINGNTFYNRIIVAGGGGGGGEDIGDGTDIFGGVHGYGGGLEGGEQRGGYNNNTNPEHGGSQTEAGLGGAFGLGANTRCDGGGGGGGWYGGGTYKGTQTMPTSNDSDDSGRGGGGSGYVYTSSTAGNYPSGCRLNSSLYLTNAQTIAGKNSFLAVNGGNETGHEGNGYARITTVYYPIGTAGSIEISCSNVIAPILNHVSGAENQSFCGLQRIEDIVFSYDGGATGLVVNGDLPAGVAYNMEGQTLTISGTPTETGTFTFSVSTTSASSLCANETHNLSISINANPSVSINAESTAICNGSNVVMNSNPSNFNSYSWTCASASNGTAGMPSVTNGASLTVNPSVSQGNGDVVYNLVVTDANNCNASATQTISVSQTPTAVITPTANSHCIAPFNGSITIANFSGGLANSTYTVSVSGQTTQTTTGNALTFNALEAGSYTVRITNESTSANCYYEETVTIADNSANPIVTISGSNTVCYGTNTTLSADVSGGLAPYNYVWSDNSTEQNFVTPNLTESAQYSVIVTDGNNCSTTASVNVTIGDTPEISLSAMENQICLGESASLQVSVSNAGAGYSVQWSATPLTGSGLTSTSGENISLTPTAIGTYKYKATLTSYSCGNGQPFVVSDSAMLTVNALPLPTITNNSGATELNCSVSAISVTANGGTLYHWSNSVSTANNLFATAGTYYVTVTDINGCSATSSISITQAEEFSASISSVGIISCYGGTTSASVMVSGGTPMYHYSWSNGHNTQTANGLAAGSYTVTVGDSGGCTAVLPVDITQPMELNASIVAHDVQCGISQGSLNATVLGGTQPYNYMWSNGITTAENLSVAAGSYGVTVVDANGCTATSTAQISRQGMLSVEATVSQAITCHGYNDGIVAAQCQNGAEPMSYSWNTGNLSSEIYNLLEGAYIVTVTDAWGCTGQAGVNLVSPSEIDVQTVAVSPKCHNTADGRITVTVFGGMAPYGYQWNLSTSGSELANLGAGTYSLTVSDAVGCSVVRNISLDAPEAITVDVAVQDVVCNGDRNGRIEVSAQGGAEPYSYYINGREARSGVIENLSAGSYAVVAVDDNGCDAKQSANVMEHEKIELSATVTAPTCKDLNDASVEITVVGGTAPYSYALETYSSDSAVFANLRPSVYSVFVTDANGCSSGISDIIVPESKLDCIRIPNVFTPNGDGVNDEWIIENIELFPEAHIYVYNRWGQLLYHGRGDSERWDGSYRGHFVPSGVYMYLVSLESVEEKYEGTVTVLY